MFLGNLSSENERRARRNKKRQDDMATVISGLTIQNIFVAMDKTMEESELRRAETEREILYNSSDNKDIPRDVILSYFRDCSEMILSLTNIDTIIGESVSNTLPLHVAAMEYQRGVLLNNFGIEKDYGCRFLSSVTSIFPDDEEVATAALGFMYAALRSFVKAVRRRATTVYASSRLRTDGGMERGTILEFFEACNALMALKETKEYLMSCVAKGMAGNKVVIDLQRNVLVLLGYDADYACSFLDKMSQLYSQDREIISKLQQFALCAQLSAKEAAMSESEREKYYEGIPVMMRHFPHLYFMQHQQQQQATAGRVTQGMAFLQTPEGMEMIQGLWSRLPSLQKQVEEMAISNWTEDQRNEFFDEMGKKEFLQKLQETGVDASARIRAFCELGDDDLMSVLTMQSVFLEDQKGQGPIAKAIHQAQMAMWQAAAQANKKGGDVETASKVAHEESSRSASGQIGSMLATLGSLNNFGRSMTARPSHGHEDGCPHCQGHSTESVDVATGKSDKMDR